MSRLAAVWQEFWKSFTWIGSVPDTADKMRKIGGLLALLIGPAALASTATDWGHIVKPFLPYFLGVSAICIIWKLAIAWEKSSGPIIWIGKPEPDEYQNFFDLRVQNRGHGEVIARVFAQDLCDRRGKRIPRIDDEIEIQWRGYHQGQNMKLRGDKPGIAAILQVDKTNPIAPILNLVIPQPSPATGLLPLLPGALRQLEKDEVRITFRVDFYDDKDVFLKNNSKRFSIRPDNKSPMCYRIRRIR
jgi:hypothetical protein